MKKMAINAATGMLAALYHLCTLFGTKRRIVCISRQSDVAPIDFVLLKDEFAKCDPPYRTIILADKLGNPLKYIFVMVKQVFYIATSQAVILDSYCIVVGLLNNRIKAPVIQIWHALGNMKKFGYATLDTEEGRSSEIAHLMHMHEGYDAVAVSSVNFAEDLAKGFNVDPSIVFEAPLPRTDLLLDESVKKSQRKSFFDMHPHLGSKPMILYCPTFRRAKPDNEDGAMAALIEAVDFDLYDLVYMPHPVSDQKIDDARVTTVSRGDIDPLFAADYVITDYSTIIYEAGLLGLPVYMYAYDWPSYSQKRAFNIDLEHDVPTLFTDDADRIMDACRKGSFDFDRFKGFIESNIAIPIAGTCTSQMCKSIKDFVPMQ